MKLFSPAVAKQNIRRTMLVKAGLAPASDKASLRAAANQAVLEHPVRHIPMRQNRQVLSKRRNLKPWSKALMS